MPKFRKKSLIIDAEQWFPGNGCRGVQGDDRTKLCGCVLAGGDASIPHVHPTRYPDAVYIEPGDWIVAEADGSGYYPCKPDVFEATYDPVEQSE
jgi:hypothetical protein